MAYSIIKQKSFAFALRDHKEFELARQLLRAGTSIGSNVEEALAAISRPEFVAKMSIASKEARESCYWLRLLRDSKVIPEAKIDLAVRDCAELIRILTSIVKTSQNPSSSPPSSFPSTKN